MEEDSVDVCLYGILVVDPLIPEQTSDSAILAPDPVTPVPSVILQDAPDVHLQEAISSPLPEADRPNGQIKTLLRMHLRLRLLFRLGQAIYLLPSRRKIFFTCSLRLRLSLIPRNQPLVWRLPADVEPFSNPAGQDRVRELMSELPTLNLE